MDGLNNTTPIKETELVVKKFSTRKMSGTDDFYEFYKAFMEGITSSLQKFSQKIE